jgi:hypothetical protein
MTNVRTNPLCKPTGLGPARQNCPSQANRTGAPYPARRHTRLRPSRTTALKSRPHSPKQTGKLPAAATPKPRRKPSHTPPAQPASKKTP